MAFSAETSKAKQIVLNIVPLEEFDDKKSNYLERLR